MRHTRWLPAVAMISSALAAGCFGGGSASQPDAGNGASNNAGAQKKDAGSHGDAGASAADFAAIWKRQSSDLTIFDTADPTNYTTTTVQLPAILPEPVDGHDLDIYQQIKDNQLITYAFRAGDKVYYRIAHTVQKSGDSYVATSGTDSHVFTIDKGQLVDSGSTLAGGLVISLQATHVKYTGAFPPSGWPTQVLEVQ